MAERYDFSNDKVTGMLRFFSVVEAKGMIYPRPSGKNSSFVEKSYETLVPCV